MNSQEQFWESVAVGAAGSCWPWKLSRRGKGYGSVRWGGRMLNAHRVALQLSRGEEFAREVHVLHRCDNRLCCNPAHLFLGSNADNVLDKTSKGRQVRGESHPNNRLTEAQVFEIKRRRAMGETTVALAAEFGISHGHISNMMAGRTWTHLSSDGMPA